MNSFKVKNLLLEFCPTSIHFIVHLPDNIICVQCINSVKSANKIMLITQIYMQFTMHNESVNTSSVVMAISTRHTKADTNYVYILFIAHNKFYYSHDNFSVRL